MIKINPEYELATLENPEYKKPTRRYFLRHFRTPSGKKLTTEQLNWVMQNMEFSPPSRLRRLEDGSLKVVYPYMSVA